MSEHYSEIQIELIQYLEGAKSAFRDAFALVDVLTENTRFCEDKRHEEYINILYGKMSETEEGLDKLTLRIENPLMTPEKRIKAVQSGCVK